MPPHHLPADVLAAPAPRTGRLLAGLLPAAGLVPAASTIVAVALPAIMADLGMGPAAIVWLVTGYLMLVAVLHPLGGALGDRAGHRRVLLAGTAVLVGAAAGAAAAPTGTLLVVARLGQGAAGALIVPNALALIRRGVDQAVRTRAVGRFMGVMAAAAVIGVTGGGMLVAVGGWRAAFTAMAVAAATALAAGTLLLDRRPVPPPQRSPAPGGPARALLVPATGIALANLAAYVALLTLPQRWDAAGWSAATAGVLLGGFAAANAAGGLGLGRLAARLGRGQVVVAGQVLAAAALAVVAVGPQTPLWLGAALLVAGGGLGLGAAGLLSLAVDAAGHGNAGASSGLLSTARYAGSITGSALLPALFAVGGHGPALAVAAAAALGGAVTAPRANR